MDMGFSSPGAVIEPPFLTEVPPIRCRQPWLVQNGFSPLSVLGNGLETEFGEGEVSLGKGKLRQKIRVVILFIRRKRGQWTLVGNFKQTLGFTFYRGRPVGWLWQWRERYLYVGM